MLRHEQALLVRFFSFSGQPSIGKRDGMPFCVLLFFILYCSSVFNKYWHVLLTRINNDLNILMHKLMMEVRQLFGSQLCHFWENSLCKLIGLITFALNALKILTNLFKHGFVSFSEIWRIHCHGYVAPEREGVTKSFFSNTVSAAGFSRINRANFCSIGASVLHFLSLLSDFHYFF